MPKTLMMKYPFHWLLGFFSTASVVALIVGGRVFPMYMLMLIPVFIDLVIHFRWGDTFALRGKEERHFYIWMIISILATIVGYLFFTGYPEWQSTTMSYLPKILIYLALMFLLSGCEGRDARSKAILNGLKFGIIANLVWSLLDAAAWYLLGFSLTNRVFAGYIQAMDIRYGQLSLIKSDGQFRSGGLNGDPANIGLFATILAGYSLKTRKVLYYGLSVLSAFASVSMIAFVGIIAVTVIHYFRRRRKFRLTRRQALSLFVGIGVLAGLVVLNSSLIERMLGSVTTRVEMKSTEGDDIRMQYFSKFLPAVLDEPRYLVIGTGYMTASYPYLIHGYTSEEFFPYDPEVTYFANYFDFGLLGFIFFVVFYVELFLLFKRRVKSDQASDTDYLLYACLLGALIAFFGYHYSLYSVVMLFSICAVVQVSPVKSRSKYLALGYER